MAGINTSVASVIDPMHMAFSTDSYSVDAFARVRVSLPHTVFDSTLTTGKMPLLWGEALTGGGTSTHLPNESSVSLAVGTASGDKVIRQTHKYFRYQPGKSHYIMMTAVFGAAQANTRRRLGAFDAQNGVFVEQTGAGLSIVQRSFTSGAAVDTAVAQANWNLDRMDGTGASQVTLDPTKAQIWCWDYEWLGVGRVRYGVIIAGKPIYVHQMLNANALTSVYMTTGNLPLRVELENTGATSGASTMKQICATILSEGGELLTRGPIEASMSTGTTKVAVTTRRPILTMRPKATFNGIVNRGLLLPNRVQLMNSTNDCYYEIIRNGTLGGVAAVWTSAGTHTMAEFDVASTTLTGGDRVFEGFVPGGAGNSSANIAEKIWAQSFPEVAQSMALSLNFDGTSQDTLSLVVTSMSGTCNVSGAFDSFGIY